MTTEHAVVVGAGIVGLATARALLERGSRVTVVERETSVGAHQSSHNSGVVHAGVYYEPGSDKAVLCREGGALLRDFCAREQLPYRVLGKVVVATSDGELARLTALHERATSNGVPGLRRIDARELATIEPAVRAVAALHVPTTAAVDFGQVTRRLAQRFVEAGGELLLDAAVTELSESSGGVRVVAGGATIRADRVVVCAGVEADRLEGDRGAGGVVPFRGQWLELTGPSADLIRGNVYPVPDPTLPFLGVHASRGIDGRVHAGPNAVLSLTRRSYRRRWSADLTDIRDTLRHPGLPALARAHLRAGVDELVRDVWLPAAVARLRRLIPDVVSDDVRRGPWGIRAQWLGPDGSLVGDFQTSRTARILHLRNAPSPAATSSLAIGRRLAAEITS